MSTREQFIEVCGSEAEAIAWEHEIHCTGAEFFPSCRLDQDASKYWQFLIEQVLEMQAENEALSE